MTSQHYPDAGIAPCDPAFEPQAEFDFEDTNEDFRNLHHDLTSLQHYGSMDQFLFMGGQGVSGPQGALGHAAAEPFDVNKMAFMPDTSFESTNVWDKIDTPRHDSFATANEDSARLPQSMPGFGGSTKGSTAARRFGQLTPPDDASSSALDSCKVSCQSDKSESARLNKSERARNAAIQRHARKRSRADSNDGSVDGLVEDKREKYREKNRLAAAKCRQKKKENVDDLEVRYRELSADHNFMKRDVRLLRDELTTLRTLALGHTEDNPTCQCRDLHQFNRNQARRLASNASSQQFDYSHIPSPLAASDGSMSAAISPGNSDSMASGRKSSGNPTIDSPILEMRARTQSFAPSNIVFAHSRAPQSTQTNGATVRPSDNNMRDLIGYPEGSPGSGLANFDF